MKVLIVFGTRPEAIKMAPLILELKNYPEKYEISVCVTGQHREMLDQVLNLFEIIPDFDLNIMETGQDLFDVTSRVLHGMRDVLDGASFDMVLVHGDTTTSTAAALSAFYRQIPVGHVEAGLRTHNIYSPWPEEMNRQITSRIANIHFAPTSLSKKNLIAEGVIEKDVYVTGNTVIDALFWVVRKINSSPNIKSEMMECFSAEGISRKLVSSWIIKKRKLVLITGHRRENFGIGLLNICSAIKELSLKYPQVDFVYPMHLNPNVRKPITEVFDNKFVQNRPGQKEKIITLIRNVYFVEPFGYLPFVYLMSLSHIVLTDSGGIQEEAPGLGKPVLVMRDTTERPEAIESGTVKLVGIDKATIVSEVSELISDSEKYNFMSKATNPYGDGEASMRISNALDSFIFA